jgi:hypothetical protein
MSGPEGIPEEIGAISDIGLRMSGAGVKLTVRRMGAERHEILTIEAGAYFEGQVQSLESVDPDWAAMLARA